MFVKIGANVARRRAPKTCWCTPVGRRRRRVNDVRRDVLPGKVPHGHASRRIPQKSKDTSPDIVKPVPKRTRAAVLDRTASISALRAVAIAVEDVASKRPFGRCVDRAGRRCPAVKRHLIVSLIVDALYDIDLSRRGP